jgi:outer membrane receptor protein involved in Fe transport
VNASAANQNSELQQAGYAKVNAQLVWKHGRYQLRGWVNNAFNAKVYAYGLDLRGAGFPTITSCLPPRAPTASAPA